ncbi:MAG TPA: type II toxin-antitoxin system prevent-host-death family antitoxin [Longimicrobium sp.]
MDSSIEQEEMITLADLRRSARELLVRAESGDVIVVHRGTEPVGILLGYDRYRRMIDFEERPENFELLLRALDRVADVAAARDELISLGDVMAEFGLVRQEAEKG